MNHKLHPFNFSDLNQSGVIQIFASLFKSQSTLELKYEILGDIERILLPKFKHNKVADELWKTTCFECFIGEPNNYFELNFSPDGRWNAYHFDGYRTGMKQVESKILNWQSKFQPVQLGAENTSSKTSQVERSFYEFEVKISIPSLLNTQTSKASICSVIEYKSPSVSSELKSKVTNSNIKVDHSSITKPISSISSPIIEYWSNYHAKEKPDFHAFESFLIDVNSD